MIWRTIYYAIMACYAALIALMLADRFPGFFNNFAVQITGVCGGFIALFFLWQNRPGSESKDESEVGYNSTLKTDGK